MIKFQFNSNTYLPSKLPTKYPEILKYDGCFKIIIDDKIYFEDNEFCIYEFIYYITKWLNCENRAMEYNCVDTEENPLISFTPYENQWKISSPWQNFKNNVLFSADELKNALAELITTLGDNTGDGRFSVL